MQNDDATKLVVVLARRDHAEAMRVAAGLTIFGHAVELVFMDHIVEDNEANRAQAEMLELADIVPRTTVEADADLECVNNCALAQLVERADHVLNV